MTISFDKLFSVANKVAVVTGGSRGLGEMMAAGLLQHGAKVYISSRKAEACDETAKRLSEQYQAECMSLPADLSGLAGIEKLVAELEKREDHIDILINNAGAAWGAPLDEFPESGWDKVMAVNVKGVFFLTQKLLPLLRISATNEDPARVINIGSVDGLRVPLFDTFSYPISKAAVHHMTRVLSAKLAKDNITVNAIAPGPFPTWMLSTGMGFGGETEGVDWDKLGGVVPLGRLGTPEDIAGLAIFLCSRAGAYVVGQTIALDGGLVAAA